MVNVKRHINEIMKFSHFYYLFLSHSFNLSLSLSLSLFLSLSVSLSSSLSLSLFQSLSLSLVHYFFPLSLSLSVLPYLSSTIFELKDFVETKSRETDYESCKGSCVKVMPLLYFPLLSHNITITITTCQSAPLSSHI